MGEVTNEASIIQRFGGRASDEIPTVDPHHDREGALQRDAEVHIQRDKDVEVETILADLTLDNVSQSVHPLEVNISFMNIQWI